MTRKAITRTALGKAVFVAAVAAAHMTGRPASAAPDAGAGRQGDGRVEGLLRRGPGLSWSLLSATGKDAASYRLQWTDDSICSVGFGQGRCADLMTYFARAGRSQGAGDNVSVVGDRQGDIIIVRRLILNDNFVITGQLVKPDPRPGERSWRLRFVPPLGDSVNQDPNRPASSLALRFDRDSLCDETGSPCDVRMLRDDDPVFVRGIRRQGVLLVRRFAVVAPAPTARPRE